MEVLLKVRDLSHFSFSLLRLPGVNTKEIVRQWVDADAMNRLRNPRGERDL